MATSQAKSTSGQCSWTNVFFFNIFINDLFLQIKTVQLNLYADDGQLYTSETDPVSLERRISREVSSANAWYEINGVIANPSKHREMILGNTDHQFNFSVNDSMELFGVTIDKNLTFKQHVHILFNFVII